MTTTVARLLADSLEAHDIDLIFTGNDTPHRNAVLSLLARRHSILTCPVSTIGPARIDMIARATGQKFDGANSLYPNVADGVDGMNFITQSVASSAEGGAWKPLKHPLCRS